MGNSTAAAVSTLLNKGGGEVGLEDGQGVDGGQQPEGCSQLPALKGGQGLQHSLAVDRGVIAADEWDQNVGTQSGDSALHACRSISGGKHKHLLKVKSCALLISSALCVVCMPNSCSGLLMNTSGSSWAQVTHRVVEEHGGATVERGQIGLQARAAGASVANNGHGLASQATLQAKADKGAHGSAAVLLQCLTPACCWWFAERRTCRIGM